MPSSTTLIYLVASSPYSLEEGKLHEAAIFPVLCLYLSSLSPPSRTAATRPQPPTAN